MVEPTVERSATWTRTGLATTFNMLMRGKAVDMNSLIFSQVGQDGRMALHCLAEHWYLPAEVYGGDIREENMKILKFL